MLLSQPMFSLSLDCEGLWGMADQPQLLESRVISRNSLRSAYEFLDPDPADEQRKGNCRVCFVLCSWH